MPTTFEHEKYFRFDRDHNTECVTCHINNDYANYTCYGCHEHSRSKIREEHVEVEEGIRDYENCTECYRSEDEAKRIWRSKDFNAGKLRSYDENSDNERKHKYHDDDD